MLQLLTRALSRAPARASVSAVALAMIAGAGLIIASSAPHAFQEPGLASTAASPTTSVQAATVLTPRPVAADLTCLTKAVYYEARGETEEGQVAVAQVVLNRLHRPEYAQSICGVVYQGSRGGQCQFSFICNGSMGRPLEPVAWSRARRIALAVFSGARHGSVGQAVSFHAAREGSRGHVVAHIGGHVFFEATRA